ncbi:hypothetical protein PFICI_00167 [Pestalotiopsis fici W106-1]|uniref:Transcription factor domain-containing protein n=1 Tax=Pestalotiopsis fici (strain W106-1 / CGMCC3.15140) TaxID=1229662 RepID=W3XJZ1_PESFW|nr:uncharacterized protein PFICI_00167 [Pestalotiopsis fici W106-1]ETS86339.1 hypothetical protein PFICI_00167 [Pestalotiopsis fici W106-1]
MTDSGLRFITVAGGEKPDAASRKNIRSHVMVGKNRGKKFPNRKRKSKVQTAAEDPREPAGTLSRSIIASLTAVPPKFGSALSTIHFANDVQPREVEIVLRFCSILGKSNSELRRCIEWERRQHNWLPTLSFDPALLHASIFVSRRYFHTVAPRNYSTNNQADLPHLLQALRLLRENIAQKSDVIPLTTVITVLCLAMDANMMGDMNTAMSHMKALRQLIDMHGGVGAMRAHRTIWDEITLNKLIRCDIAIILGGGSRNTFYDSITASEPFTPYPSRVEGPLEMGSPTGTVSEAITLKTPATFPGNKPDELARAWRAISDLCMMMDSASVQKKPIPFQIFLDTMAAVIYRLLAMDFDPNSASEILRIGLLIFSYNTYIQWQVLGVSYSAVAAEFKDCLINIDSLQLDSSLALWLVMVGSTMIFDETDDCWLKPLLRRWTKRISLNHGMIGM